MDSKLEDVSDEPGKLPFNMLRDISNNFAPERKLGSGASGEVYKGVFEDGKVIAIKKLRYMPSSDNKQFENEFEHLKRFKHQNIVQLVGFCDEEEGVCVELEGKMVHAVDIHRALCLEFVPNGGLGKFLSEKYPELNWHTRFRIIEGTCHGLKYLHDLHTMHFDLKPDNILLDEKMMPKIADFGLSRLLGEENTVMTKTPLGTIGYLPPEFINKQVISKKYDIFSLGVIIKKIVAGTDYWDISNTDDRECIEHVHCKWRRRLQQMPAYASFEMDCKQVRTCIEIAVDCTQEDPHKRPTMNEIVCRLSNVENKEIYSEVHDAQFFLPVPERPSPGGKNVVQSELRSEDNRMENKSLLYTVELSLEFLSEITSAFSTERIISGGIFATFFKGILCSGEEIAVKRFGANCVAIPYNMFLIEVANLMELEHKNVLRLIGFCCEKKKKVVKLNGRYILVDEVESYLCHEYAQSGSLHKYIYGGSSRLDWSAQFKIIMGICEGLHFLHTELDIPVIDTSLAPEDILLDSNMVPKLSDVGVSKLFDRLSANTPRLLEFGYNMAPESCSGRISVQSDIYRLGLLIMQIAVGRPQQQSRTDYCGSGLINRVRGWQNELVENNYRSSATTSTGQLKLCLETAIRCTDLDPMKRPSIKEIIETLKSGYSGSMLDKDITSSSTASRSQLMSSLQRELSSYQNRHVVSVQPQRLCFPLDQKRLTSCLLYLTNDTNERIAFSLMAKTPRKYHTKLPLCGIVSPKGTHALALTMREQKKKPLKEEEFLSLQCSIARKVDLKNVDPASIIVFFEKAKEKTANVVQEMMLPVVVSNPLEEVTTSNQSIKSAEIISSQNHRQVFSVDVHPKEPWILTSNHRGTVCIWNYQKRETVKSFEVSTSEPVYVAKFIERKNWLVAGDGDGYIHVYSCYDTMEEVDSFEAHGNHIMSLAVNPSFSFLLSASDDHLIKLWDWNKGWECIRTFEGHYNRITQVMFHPKDSVNFASASLDRRVKIWNIFTGKCNITFDEQPDSLLCLQYFEDKQLRYIRQFLIVGSSDGVAKVWDPEKHSCVGTLEGHAGRLNALCWLPKHELLVTGSLDGTVQLWKPTDTYRLENTIGLNLGAVNALGYIEELKGVVVGCEQGIAIVNIYSYEEKEAKSVHDCILQTFQWDIDMETDDDFPPSP